MNSIKQFLLYFVLVISLLLYTKVSLSQDDRWILISSEENPSRSFYYDSKSIEYDGNTILFWQKWVFWESSCSETYVLAQFYCGKRLYKWKKQINECNGLKKSIDLSEMNWNEIEPETLDEKYYFTLCK